MPRDSLDSNQPVCPKCFQPIRGSEDFCKHCGVPLTLMATSGPYEQVLSMGYAYRQASSSPHKPIVVVGIWLLMGPTFVFSVLVLAVGLFNLPSILQGAHDFDSIFPIVALAVFFSFWAYVSGKLILRTMLNYRRQKEQPEIVDTVLDQS